MIGWLNYVHLLGLVKFDEQFTLLPELLGDLPLVERDMSGERIYFSFLRSGVLFIIENELVCQISFFLCPKEGFNKYCGELPANINLNQSEEQIIMQLGVPSSNGGGKQDILIGHINRWIKYIYQSYSLHLEFSQNGLINKISLMINE